MQRIEMRLRSSLPRCEQYAASAMPFGNGAEPRRVFCRRLGRASAFDLNQDDLQSIAALQLSVLAVILANRYQVHNSARFAAALSIELDEMPSGIWLIGDRAADRNLGHGHGPSGSDPNQSEAALVFGGIEYVL